MNGQAMKDRARSSAHRERLLKIKNVLYWCQQLNLMPEEVQKLSQQQKTCRRLLVKQAEELNERRKEQFKRWQNLSELRWLMYEEQRKYNERCGQEAADISIWQILSTAQYELEQELGISNLLGSCHRFPSPMSIVNTNCESPGTGNVLKPLASVIMGMHCNNSLGSNQRSRLSGENLTPCVSQPLSREASMQVSYRQLSGEERNGHSNRRLSEEKNTSRTSSRLSGEELSPLESSFLSEEDVTPHASRQMSEDELSRWTSKQLAADILTPIQSELKQLASGQFTHVKDPQLQSQFNDIDNRGQKNLVNELESTTSVIQLSRSSKYMDSSESDDEHRNGSMTTDEFIGIRTELRKIQKSTHYCDTMIDMLFAEYLEPIPKDLGKVKFIV